MYVNTLYSPETFTDWSEVDDFKVTDDIARNQVYALPTQLHHFCFPVSHADN
jgi:hypothetical protein